jgi:aspartate/methionine/tyrosine aminotransferase
MSVIRAFSDSHLNRDVIRLTAGDPDFNTPEYIVEAARKAMESGETHYTSALGELELREAIATKLKRDNGFEADPKSEIAVTNGATGALSLTLLAILNEGDQVLVPDPGWPNYEPMIFAAGGTPIRYPLRKSDEFLPRPEEVESLVGDKCKAIIVNSPSNPAGSVFSRELLEQFIEIARKKRIFLLSDEVYEKIIYDNMRHVSIASLGGADEVTLTINSFSKTYAMTGWRIGYVAGPKSIVGAVGTLQSAINTCPSSISQAASLAALLGPQSIVDDMVADYTRRRAKFIGDLREITGVWAPWPRGAFYALVDFSSISPSSSEMARRLITEARVAAVPGAVFGEQAEGHVRFSFASSMRELELAAKAIADMLKKSRQ